MRGKAGDHAMRRSAFVEAISHLGKAIALSDKAGGVARPRVAAVSISASRDVKLQTRLWPGRHVDQGLHRRRDEGRLRASKSLRPRLAMPRRRSTPVMRDGCTVYSAASLGPPGKRPRASCA